MYWDQGGLCTGQRGTGPEGASRKKDLRVLVFNPLNPPPKIIKKKKKKTKNKKQKKLSLIKLVC